MLSVPVSGALRSRKLEPPWRASILEVLAKAGTTERAEIAAHSKVDLRLQDGFFSRSSLA